MVNYLYCIIIIVIIIIMDSINNIWTYLTSNQIFPFLKHMIYSRYTNTDPTRERDSVCDPEERSKNGIWWVIKVDIVYVKLV